MSKIISFIERYGLQAFAVASAIVAPMAASAVLTSPSITIPSNTGLGSLTGVSSELTAIADWMFYFLIILAVIFVVVAAYRYLTAAGDPEKVKSANKTLLYAAIALLVGILARAIPSLVGSIVGTSVSAPASGAGAGTIGQ